MRKTIFLLLVALVIAAGIFDFYLVEIVILSVLTVLLIDYYRTEPAGYLISFMSEISPDKNIKKYLRKKRNDAYSVSRLSLCSLYVLEDVLEKYCPDMLTSPELKRFELLKTEVAKKIYDKEVSEGFWKET